MYDLPIFLLDWNTQPLVEETLLECMKLSESEFLHSIKNTVWIKISLHSLIMLIVTYDIHNDKLRTKFGKFLKKYGRRLQYSVFEIKNSDRILGIVKREIEAKFEPEFT